MSVPLRKIQLYKEIFEETKYEPELHQDRIRTVHRELLDLKDTYAGNAEIYDFLGMFSCLLDLREDAYRYHNAAITIEPSSWIRRFNFGVTAERFLELDKSINCYEESLSCNPSDDNAATTWAYLAINYYRTYKPIESLEAFERVLKLPIGLNNACYIIANILKLIKPKKMDAQTLFVLGSLEYFSLALKKSLEFDIKKRDILLGHTNDYFNLIKEKTMLAIENKVDFKDVDQEDLKESFEGFQGICQELNVLPVFDEEFDLGVAYDLPARS